MIPVVMIHKHGAKDDRYPLAAIMEHDKRFGNQVVLIEDGADAEINLEDYSERAAEFEKYYVHMSGNHRAFELICFQRWYILESWMRRNNQPIVMHTDSDVLLYCDVDNHYAPYEQDAFTLALGSSAATSYFTLAGLQAFLDFVDDIYVNRNANFTEFQRIYREMQAQGLAGGLVDMSCFKFFKEQVTHIHVGEMAEVHGGVLWDHNIWSADGLVMKDEHKRVIFRNGVPYGTLLSGEQVRFNSLHFQGGRGKRLLREFLSL